MKKILPVLAFTMVTMHSTAQGRAFHIPPEVTKAFVTQFPGSHLKKWEQRKEGYMATFRQNGKKYVAYYTVGGAWEATESPVKWTWLLPQAVQDAWKKSTYSNWLILDIKKIVMPEQTLYALHVGLMQSLGPDDADMGSEYVLFFSAKGELVKKDLI